MADLSHKLEMVLDKLYNLKGEDNVILVKINKDIRDTENAIAQAKETQKQTEANKKESQEKLQRFLDQKQIFEEAFAGLDNDTFGALSEIGVKIELGTMLTTISDKSPEYIASLEGEIKKYELAVEELISRGVSLEETLSANLDAKSKAEEDQRRLISLLEQSLSKEPLESESLTVHHIKGVLSSFGIFDATELSKLAKLIMFPDEGLGDYNANYANRKLTSAPIAQPVVEEVVEEPTEALEIADEPTEEPVEEIVEEVAKNPSQPIEEPVEAVHQDIEEQLIVVPQLEESYHEEEDAGAEEVVEEPAEAPVEEPVMEDIIAPEEGKESIEEFLISIGLDIEKFKTENITSVDEIYRRLAEADHRVITENYEILRSIDVKDEIYQFRKGHMYLIDKDLNKKLTLLRSKGVSEARITELVKRNNSGMRESYDVFESRVNAIENIDGKVDDSNIFILCQDTVQYEKNLEILQENGYELEDKERRNHCAILFESPYLESDSEVLKKYLISIQKANGKYALGIFWKTPEMLLQSIDDLVENDLENLIATNPEVLGYNCDNAIGRVKYCESKGIPIYKDNANTFVSYITDHAAFDKKFGGQVVLPKLPTREEVNASLSQVIGNEVVEIMVNTLDVYYANNSFLSKTDLDSETQAKLEELQADFELKYHAQVTGKFTYTIAGVNISKIKFERNLAAILHAIISGGQSVDGIDTEIILTAALYNLRKDNEELMKVAGSCLGFNEENTLGGVRL